MKFQARLILLGVILTACPLVFQASAVDEDWFLGKPEFKEGQASGHGDAR